MTSLAAATPKAERFQHAFGNRELMREKKFSLVHLHQRGGTKDEFEATYSANRTYLALIFLGF